VFLLLTHMFVFTWRALPFHLGVCVSGHFKDLAAGAFLPPPRSPAKNSREPRSPPPLSQRNDEATPPISFHGKITPREHTRHVGISLRLRFQPLGLTGQLPVRRAYSSEKEESGMDTLFLKSVYCLSGLEIVRKNRRKPKHFNSNKLFVSCRVNYK